MATLIREPIAPQVFDRTVLQKARKVLSYEPDAVAEDACLRMLASVNVHPFKRELVESYRSEMSLRVNGLRDRLECIPVIAASFVTFFLSMCTMAACADAILAAKFCAAAAGVSVLAIIASGIVLINLPSRNKWYTESLRHYRRPVPEFALQTAIDVQEVAMRRNMKVELDIESFGIPARTLDPFLVLVHNGTKYYLEVWDEPSFVAGRREESRVSEEPVLKP